LHAGLLFFAGLVNLIDRQTPNLILKFGGHAMAAGLSIKKANFPQFKTAFASTIQTHLNMGGWKKAMASWMVGVLVSFRRHFRCFSPTTFCSINSNLP
jgi:hypothetical protein